MKTLLALLALMPGAGFAETLICTSHDFCDSRLICATDKVDLAVSIAEDGSAEFGFTEARMFTAPAIEHEGFTTWSAHEADGEITLSLGDGMDAVLLATGVEDGKVVTAFQLLDCTAAE